MPAQVPSSLYPPPQKVEAVKAMLAQTLQVKKSVDDVWPLTGKRVLLRADFNVNINSGVVDNDYHIRAAVPTIRRIVEQGGICIIMSHLGRPMGVDSDVADADFRKRRHSQHFQENRGKTAFFSVLSGPEKVLILSWSSKKESAEALGSQENTGKTVLFSRLPEEEKKALLSRFLNDNKDRLFPQLKSAAGFEEENSLQVVAIRLAELLGQHVFFAHDCLYAKHEIMKLRSGDVMLLENVRFYSNEISPDEEKRMKMARVLASYGDVYVNDAFGATHRSSATVTGIPKIIGHGAAGYLMEREISYFSRLLNRPRRPLVAIMGGAKVSDKIKVLDNMLNRIDCLIIGGGMAFSFLKAQGHGVGNSLCEDDCVKLAAVLLRKAKEREVDVLLPVDHICNTDFKPTSRPYCADSVDVPDGFVAMDIGPKTIAACVAKINKSQSAIWNGPVGVFEMPCFAEGTFSIVKALGDATKSYGLLSIISGGDSASAAERSGAASRISHISMGGPASLQLLEGRHLPGIDILDDRE